MFKCTPLQQLFNSKMVQDPLLSENFYVWKMVNLSLTCVCGLITECFKLWAFIRTRALSRARGVSTDVPMTCYSMLWQCKAFSRNCRKIYRATWSQRLRSFMPSLRPASITVTYCWLGHRRLRLTSYSVSWMPLLVLSVTLRSSIADWRSLGLCMSTSIKWLDVPERVKYKLVSMVHNCLHAPESSSVPDGLLHSNLRCGQSSSSCCAATQSQHVRS